MRDERGRVVEPARIWLSLIEHPERPPAPAAGDVPMPSRWLARCAIGDIIRFEDERGSARKMTVSGAAGAGRFADLLKTATT